MAAAAPGIPFLRFGGGATSHESLLALSGFNLQQAAFAAIYGERVWAQLEHLARLSGLDSRSAAAGVERWLARLGLRERGEGRLDAPSHGNQQRVQLATALVHDPVALGP